MTSSKHENYETLNLIGYGLAKFDKEFIHQFNCTSKNQFYQKMVEIKVAETIGTIKNRQDLFDPFIVVGSIALCCITGKETFDIFMK